MTNETLDILQEMLGLIRAQGRRIATLEARSALQNCALVALLENAGEPREPSADTVSVYRSLRTLALETATPDDARDQTRSLLRLMEDRFPSLEAKS